MKKWIVVVALLLLPIAAQAQNEGWTPPHEVETTTQSNWFPSVAIDPWGAVHLIWSSGDGTGENARDLLMYTHAQAGEWQPANDIVLTGTGGWAARSSLAIDRSGRLHVLVRTRDGVYYAAAAGDQAWSAHAWQNLRRMNGLGQPYYSAIAIGADDTIHAVWEELSSPINEQSCVGCSDMWYRQSRDGGSTWSRPTNLSNGTTGAIKPQIVFGKDDTIVVTWDEGKDPNATVGEPVGIAYVVSPDAGTTWRRPQRITLKDDAAQQSTFAIDGTGAYLLVFRASATDTILFRTSTNEGRTWSDLAPLPGLIARNINDTPWDKYSLATDSAGDVHLLAVARTDGGQERPALYHVVWSKAEQRWLQPEVVADDQYPEWPAATIAEGNQLHVTWFTRSPQDLHDSDNARYKVWYSARSIDAPTVPVVVQPTAVPSPTATPEPPLPTVVPDRALLDAELNAPLPASVRSEVPLLRFVSVVLIVPLAVCAVALVVALQRRVLSTKMGHSKRNLFR